MFSGRPTIMEFVKSFSRRSLAWLLALNLLLAAAVFSALLYVCPAGLSEAGGQWITAVFFPLSAVLFFFMALFEWVVLKGSLRRLMRVYGLAEEKAARQPPPIDKETGRQKEPGFSRDEIQKQHQRYYLHLLSVLQRQGRLLDFLEEDLGEYSNEQVGAAVRSVHENCGKAIEKYLAPRSILTEEEGAEITVNSDFDPSAIKLTGKVTGDPPFKGTLRHGGWRAGKLDLPVLSDSGDPRIIAPAEIEVA